MKSFTTLQNSYTDLSLNTTASNTTRGGQLINDRHRYLLQKYFDNERSVQLSTIGSQTLTTTASIAANATSATLSVAWPNATSSQLVNFSDGEQRTVLFTLNSTAITWSVGLTGNVTSTITTVGVQAYNLPANLSKAKDFTVSISQQKFTPVEITSRREWDQVNYLPYNGNIVNYFFIYNDQINFFPIPSTTGNVITINYKTRVPDFSFADYSTGNLTTAAVGATTITGTGTSWGTTGLFPLNTDVSFYNLMIRINPPNGDGIWYPISTFNSDISVTLSVPIVNAPNITSGTTYTIGQFPLLEEDFHDMLVYGALQVYYSSIKKDADAAKKFEDMYTERLTLLSDYAGSKTTMSVDLGQSPQIVNPNFFFNGPTPTP
jgi:hypothetical protein